MKKVLKNLDPSIRSYLGDAFCFSIINDVAFDSGWVYDKYIHLEYTPYDGQIKYADYDYYDFVPDQGVFMKSFIEYPYIHCNQGILCQLIMQMIDNDEYCFALWNESVVTAYLFEESGGVYEHGCFVYGYDSEKEVFFTQGYLSGDKWEHFVIPYTVFYKALSYCPEKGEIAVIGYKVKADYQWCIDFDKLKSSLALYTRRSLAEAGHSNYDINAEKGFFLNLKPGKTIHYPSLYCIYEHKALFSKRIAYMIQKGVIEENEILQQAHELEKMSHKILLLGLRYNASMEIQVFDMLFQEVRHMLDTEKAFAMQLCRLFPNPAKYPT